MNIEIKRGSEGAALVSGSHEKMRAWPDLMDVLLTNFAR